MENLDRKKEFDDLLSLANSGDIDACFAIGIAYTGNHETIGNAIKTDNKKAHEWLLNAAARGHELAQYHVGYMYYYGKGCEKDLGKAFYWHYLALLQDNKDSAFFFGLYFKEVKDYEQSIKYFNLAVELGDDDALEMLKEFND